MKITVIQEDIETANKAREVPGYDICAICPIAVALRRIMPEYPWYTGCNLVAHRQDAPIEEAFWLPEEAINFIDRWDAKKFVEPFEFELEIPE